MEIGNTAPYSSNAELVLFTFSIKRNFNGTADHQQAILKADISFNLLELID